MSITAAIFDYMARLFTSIISTLGYPGIFFLMTLESMVAPVPSELVMPFAGFLVAQKSMNFFLVVLVGGTAGVCGSLISYHIGLKGGKPLIMRFGKYLLISEHELDWTMNWFQKRGELTIFVSRFIPVVRHLISVPAGIGRMDLRKFIIYTFAGATLWCAILTYAGMLLQEYWEKVHSYTEKFDIPVLILIGLFCVFYIYHHIKKGR